MKYVLYLSCIDLTILRIPITWRQIERVNATLVVRKMISADHADWCKWRWLIRYVQSPGQRLTITNWDSLLTRTSSENLIFFRIWRLSISLVICPAFQISTKQARKFSHATRLDDNNSFQVPKDEAQEFRCKRFRPECVYGASFPHRYHPRHSFRKRLAPTTWTPSSRH